MFASRGGFINGSELATVTGGTLTYDGLYSVRTFTSNGNLTIVDGSLNTDRILVVGAGGRMVWSRIWGGSLACICRK